MKTAYTYTDDAAQFAHDFTGLIQVKRGHSWITLTPDEMQSRIMDCLADEDGWIEDGATGQAGGLEYRAAEAADFGTLHDYATGEELRPATSDERKRSDDEIEAGHPEGVILVDGRSCYVEP